MNYGFNDEKEKVAMYAKYEAYSSIVSAADNDWVGHRLFDNELEIWTINDAQLIGIPEGGFPPPTVIPANTDVTGQVVLPSFLVEKYADTDDITEHITVMINAHAYSNDLIVECERTVEQRGYNHYLNFNVRNPRSSTSPYPEVDIIIIARPGSVTPGPVDPEPATEPVMQ